MVFVGLVAEGVKEKAESEAFIDQHGIPWPNGYGAGRTIEALGVAGFPTLFVIGKNGKIAWNDELDGDLESALDQALAVESTDKNQRLEEIQDGTDVD